MLITTGWGDRSSQDLEGGTYVLQSPHFSLEAAKYLGERMRVNESDLLLVDTVLLGWPGNYLIPEWCSMLPTPPVESGEARMYLHLYNTDKTKADFAVEIEFARLGIMTVRKLVHCGRIKNPKVKVIVAPLQVVREWPQLAGSWRWRIDHATYRSNDADLGRGRLRRDFTFHKFPVRLLEYMFYDQHGLRMTRMKLDGETRQPVHGATPAKSF